MVRLLIDAIRRHSKNEKLTKEQIRLIHLINGSGDAACVNDQILNAERLCGLTGLTDRRHRQLAKSGYFPPPIRSQYQLWPTVTGLLKYFREQLAKRDDEFSRERLATQKAKREKAQEELAEIRRENIPKAILGPALRNVSLQQRTVLQSKLENELPAALEGMNEAGRHGRMVQVVDAICRLFQEGVKTWIQAP